MFIRLETAHRSALMIIIALSLLSSPSIHAQQVSYPGDRYGYDNTTPRVFLSDDLHIEECGSCHMAYPPELLPKDSWQKIMLGLEDHFGENAELDAETFAHIGQYLELNGLQNDHPSIETVSSWYASLPENAPLRITELPGFLKHHEDPIRRLGEGSEVEGFLSPCEDCHKEAASGIFDKERIFRGYGPVFKRFSGENL
jgi:hypothetical protein